MKNRIYLQVLRCIALFLVFVSVNSNAISLAQNRPKTKVVAHRGASGYAPESTLVAFRLAKRMQADYIELDLQRTKDNHVIVMHDQLVNRTTDGKGEVRKLTLSQLKQLNAGAWFNKKYPKYARSRFNKERIPTLAEVFQLLGRSVNYMLEFKNSHHFPGIEKQVWALVKKFKLKDRVIMQSFESATLQNIHKQNLKVPLIQLLNVENPQELTLGTLKKIHRFADGVGINYNGLNKKLIKKIAYVRLWIYVYTVDEPYQIKKMLKWQVDGIHTNFLRHANELLKR